MILRFLLLSFIGFLLVGQVGGQTPVKVGSDASESRSALVDVSLEQVRALLSKQLTVEELKRRLGKPAFEHEQNWGWITYELPSRKSLSFGFKGNFVVSAEYDRTRIAVVPPVIHRLHISMELKIPVLPGNQVVTLPGVYELDEQQFQNTHELVKKLGNLPRGSVTELFMRCTDQNPSEELIDQLQQLCAWKEIVLIIYPAG